MEKPRLFICGDSWVNFGYPGDDLHWTDYLKNHFDVHLLGLADMDNISIIYQLGGTPEYREGDRIIVVFTEPSRIFRRYMIESYVKKDIWYNKDIKRRSPYDSDLVNLQDLQFKLWNGGMRKDEINFYKFLKLNLSKYNPIFLTWSPQFAKKTNDFVELIEVSSLEDEGIMQDSHPGIKGCYDFYSRTLNLLNNSITPIPFSINSKV